MLHRVAKSSPMNLKDIIERAGYKYPTFYVHVKNSELPYEILSRYGKALNHDFSNEFPEMAEFNLKEGTSSYDNPSIEELKRDRDKWMNKYNELGEKYRVLQDKYNKMLEEKLGL